MAVELDVVEVQPREGWSIWVKFEDRVEGEVDVSNLQNLPVFASLRDRRVFESVYVHPDLKVVCWGENLEISPCKLYAALSVARVG